MGMAQPSFELCTMPIFPSIDEATRGRRVVSEKIEGTDVIGVVLRPSVVRGYAEWARRERDGAAR